MAFDRAIILTMLVLQALPVAAFGETEIDREDADDVLLLQQTLEVYGTGEEASPDMESLVMDPYVSVHAHDCDDAWDDFEDDGGSVALLALSDEPVAYLAISRGGSGSMQHALQGDGGEVPHNHACTLADLEKHNAKRIIVTVRHPVERVISSMSRNHEKGRGLEFKTADEFVNAWRNETHPQHDDAVNLTTVRGYQLPIVEFYLDSYPLTDYQPNDDIDLRFLCTNNLTAEYNELATEWDMPPMEEHRHQTSNTSGDERYMSEDNKAWVSDFYQADVDFCMEKCPRSCVRDA